MLPIFNNAKKYNDSIAIIDNKGSYTYHTLLKDATQIAQAIIAKKIFKQPILYLFSSSYEYVAVQWGIWLSNNMAVPVHTAHTKHEIDYLIADTQATLFIYDNFFETTIQTLEKENTHCIALQKLLHTNNVQNSLPTTSLEDNALMIYTSGTTGKPKGVVISHHQLDTQIRSLSIAWQWTNTDSILNVLPMHHVHGVINITCCALYNGAMVEMQPNFDAAYVALRMISKELTLFMAVPTVYQKLIQYFETLDTATKIAWQDGMKAIRLMVSGSAALPITVLKKWAIISNHTLLERYGMTEIGMALSNPLLEERKAGTVGKPLPFVQIKLVDDVGNEINTLETAGELYVKGDTVFKQYWNKPEETTKAFDNGWFKTGDIVEKTKDGYYKILGRKSSDIIKSGGYKISALEIENLLLTHNDIQECAVIALPDDVWGEIIAVAIVGSIIEADLKNWLKNNLATYKTPRKFFFANQLPRNVMGKVVKSAIKEWFIEKK
ncbi:MAG: acyl-CoA synthetase [Chitinophagaceae bacterium]|nr:acyl-CoA synthetase [Chitinophagaceae bacterium]MCW5905991.1 acyl-CoA synthetase [Chitinophagaceae bacterium]